MLVESEPLCALSRVPFAPARVHARTKLCRSTCGVAPQSWSKTPVLALQWSTRSRPVRPARPSRGCTRVRCPFPRRRWRERRGRRGDIAERDHRVCTSEHARRRNDRIEAQCQPHRVLAVAWTWTGRARPRPGGTELETLVGAEVRFMQIPRPIIESRALFQAVEPEFAIGIGVQARLRVSTAVHFPKPSVSTEKLPHSSTAKPRTEGRPPKTRSS